MSDRDPRIDPQPGDVIQQNNGKGYVIRVTKRDGDRVEWESTTPKMTKPWEKNAWTLTGWRKNVSYKAVVISSDQ